jgi:hypothetical protein
VVLLGLAACRDTDPTFVDAGPRALVRYVNASPDSPTLVVRLVDQPENWRNADGLAFRGNTGNYYAAIAGTRRLRAFRQLSVGTLDTGTVIVLDTTITLEPQVNYTIVQSGLVMGARGTAANTARVTVFVDTLPATVPAGQIQLRTYHVAQGVGNVDVAVTSNAAGSAAAATLTNIPFGGRSAYATVAGAQRHGALPVRHPPGGRRDRAALAGAGGSGVRRFGPRRPRPPPLDATAGVRQVGLGALAVHLPGRRAGFARRDRWRQPPSRRRASISSATSSRRARREPDLTACCRRHERTRPRTMRASSGFSCVPGRVSPIVRSRTGVARHRVVHLNVPRRDARRSSAVPDSSAQRARGRRAATSAQVRASAPSPASTKARARRRRVDVPRARRASGARWR